MDNDESNREFAEICLGAADQWLARPFAGVDAKPAFARLTKEGFKEIEARLLIGILFSATFVRGESGFRQIDPSIVTKDLETLPTVGTLIGQEASLIPLMEIFVKALPETPRPQPSN